MRIWLSTIFFQIFVTSLTFANNSKSYVCDYSGSGPFHFRDIVTFYADGSVDYSGQVGQGEEDLVEICVGEKLDSQLNGDVLEISGDVNCVDNEKVEINLIFNPGKNTIDGTWKGEIECHLLSPSSGFSN